MAICGFRADNLSFGLLDGESFTQLVSILEQAASGISLEGADAPLLARIEPLREAGLLAAPGPTVHLTPAGRRFL